VNTLNILGAVVVKNDEPDVTLQIGQEEWIRVYNNSGSTITNATPVYLSGEVGGIPSIAPSDAVNALGSVGLATHDIENGTTGYVTTRGLVGDVNTVGLTVGSHVHLASGGGLTQSAPQYPFYPTDLGICLIVDSAGGSIYVDLTDHTTETIRVTEDARFDAAVTIAGDLNVLGTTTQVRTQTLETGSNFIKLLDGDTLGTAYQNVGGLDDLTFKGKYTGDSAAFWFVRMSSVDSAGVGDAIEWGISDSDVMSYGSYTGVYGYGKSFDSDTSGKTTWNLLTDGLTAPLREGISVQLINISGHDSADYWCAHPTELNLDLGVIGNYNETNQPIRYAGVVRDATDQKWKFFDGYPGAGIDSARAEINFDSASLSDIQFGTAFGNLSGNATTASTATLLANPRTIAINGDVTGTATSFNGGSNISIVAAITAGSIINTDIKSDAAIADTKLATIATAGKVNNSATTATAANTASAIITRDVSGNFAGGTFTGEVNRDAKTTVTAGTYGSATAIPVLTIDANGFVDSAGTIGVSGITGVTYDSSSGLLTIATSGDDFVDSINLSPFTTANLAENTNLYYTDVRARTSISGGIGLDYNASTGVMAIESDGHFYAMFTANKGLSLTGGQFNIDSANVKAMFSGGTGITYSNGAISTTDGDIVHDSLSGFVANEHIDHSGVSVTAGAGLTGGGTIDANRTINVVGGNGITANANDIQVDSANIKGMFSASGSIAYSNGAFSFTERTAAQLLTAVKTVDGTTSGLDADLLDGQHGTHYRINVYNNAGTLLN
jgi:hypothetical protein